MAKTNSFVVATDVKLVRDAESRKAGEKNLVTLTYADNPGNDKDETQFVQVTVAGKLAEIMTDLKKGDRVNVVGKMTYNTYSKKDGTTGVGFKIDYPHSVTRVYVNEPVDAIAAPSTRPNEAGQQVPVTGEVDAGVPKRRPGRPAKATRVEMPWVDDD